MSNRETNEQLRNVFPRVNEERLDEVVCHDTEKICRVFYPHGWRDGKEWRIADSTGAEGRSLGIQLTGEKAGLCHDRATGQGWRLTQLLIESFGISFPEVARRIGALLGIDLFESVNQPVAFSRRPLAANPYCSQGSYKSPEDVARLKPDLSKFRFPTKQELHAIAQDRGLAFAAPLMAAKLHCLKVGDVCGFPSWILTDPAGWLAEGRRFGTLPYPAYGPLGRRKAHTIRHGQKSWPVGLGVDRALVERASLICVLEGGPDLLAGWHLIHRTKAWHALPISILGRAIHGLHPGALELLKGKRLRFYPHADKDQGGVDQILLIREQVRSIASAISYFDFSGLFDRKGVPIKDLNDLARLNPNQCSELFL
jgi:hypothetical protein